MTEISRGNEQGDSTLTTRRCGFFTVHIQGNFANLASKAVFLTVHDMGTNHAEFAKFVDHPSMLEIRERSVFIHVDLPGQEDNAPDLPEDFAFPTLDELGSGLVQVLDELQLEYVIGVGEGAGANIITRFCLLHPKRCLGLVLLHCTATVAGITEQMRDKIIGWKLDHYGMNATAENYLLFHKFGRADGTIDSSADIHEYQSKLRKMMNPRNLWRYVEAFLHRTDLTSRLETELNTDVLLVSGTLASHAHTVHTMATHMNKQKTTLLLLDHVGDVLTQAPEKLAEALQLFVQGLGKLSSLHLPTLRSRNPSKESFDRTEGAATPQEPDTFELGSVRRPSLSKSR